MFRNNKRIFLAAIGAPGSTHDAIMLKSTQLYRDILRENVIPNIQLHLQRSGEILLCTIGDSVFSRHPWLLKGYPKKTNISQQLYFIKTLCSGCVVTENAYRMLKGR